MKSKYQRFLENKHIKVKARGFNVSESDINPMLFKFQNAIVRWSLQLGKSAIFAECGLGKTFMELEWAGLVTQHTGKRVLILNYLAVASQTIREGEKLGIKVIYCADGEEVLHTPDNAIIVTNYDRLKKFDASIFAGVVLDESSILKNFTGKTKQLLDATFADTSYKLCGTATPAPNDYLELGNHANFLDIMPSNEMIMRWFKNDTMEAGNYILKAHGRKDFYRWLTSWAVCISHPRDLGDEYDIPGFDLPPLNLIECSTGFSEETLQKAWADGRLLPDINVSSTKLHGVKRDSLRNRVAKTVEILDNIPNDEPVIMWCDTDYEADALLHAFPESLEVRGSHSQNIKEQRLTAFSDNQKPRIITKPQIAGFGLNWQHCTNQVLMINYSFERIYQAIRRSYRFGVQKSVNVYLVFSEAEGNVLQTIYDKQAKFKEMQEEMNEAMKTYGLFRESATTDLNTPEYQYASGKDWELHLGDCVEQITRLPDNSIHFGVHSPPFSNLYIYSDSEADMGNSSDDNEFFKHYKFLIEEMHRITLPGRLCAVHCKDLPLYKGRDGAMGLRDFAGDIIRAFEEYDKPDIDDYDSITEYKTDLAEWQQSRLTNPKWVFHSRINIWKDPVIEMQRTKNHGLLHKNFSVRAEGVRQGMADYLLVFRKWTDIDELGVNVIQERKPGDYIGTEPPPEEWYLYGKNGNMLNEAEQQRSYSIGLWQRYASPVWFDIDQTNVLNHKIARDTNDDKHICPLQLDVIERAIDLWTNEGETVFTPFAGVGSELVSAIKMRRKAIGIELKESYFATAVAHLKEIEQASKQIAMF